MKKNRILSLILSVMMMSMILFPAGIFAEEVEAPEYEPEDKKTMVDNHEEETAQPAEKQPVEEQPVKEQPIEEQSVEEQPVEERPVEEQPAEEQPAEERPVEEQPVEEEPVDELLAAEETAPFEQGYVRVNGGTIVYASESKQEENPVELTVTSNVQFTFGSTKYGTRNANDHNI